MHVTRMVPRQRQAEAARQAEQAAVAAAVRQAEASRQVRFFLLLTHWVGTSA